MENKVITYFIILAAVCIAIWKYHQTEEKRRYWRYLAGKISVPVRIAMQFAYLMVLGMILFIVYLSEENGNYWRNLHGKVAAPKREEALHKHKFKQNCREIWATKRMIPVKGDGWVDIRKIPYDFLNIVEGDEGECLAESLVIPFPSFYWTGKKIIPNHPAFSGQHDPHAWSRINGYLNFDYYFTSMYPQNTWKEFKISINFYNRRKNWACENLMENYDHDYDGKCQKKCRTDDGRYLKNDDSGVCLENKRKTKYNYYSSRMIQTAIHPDIYIIPHENRPPYIDTGDDFNYTLRDWPYEPFPILRIGNFHRTHELWVDFSAMTDIQLSRHIPHSERFFIDKKDKFYFPNGFLVYHEGNIELPDAPLFFLHLRNYLSEIYIKEY